jgi:hypothetical protein
MMWLINLLTLSEKSWASSEADLKYPLWFLVNIWVNFDKSEYIRFSHY